jgi:hypothetical protein
MGIVEVIHGNRFLRHLVQLKRPSLFTSHVASSTFQCFHNGRCRLSEAKPEKRQILSTVCLIVDGPKIASEKPYPCIVLVSVAISSFRPQIQSKSPDKAKPDVRCDPPLEIHGTQRGITKP